jgi:hypothetical protein
VKRLVVVALAACSRPAPPSLVDLSQSTAAFASELDAHVQEARFLTLLSPT